MFTDKKLSKVVVNCFAIVASLIFCCGSLLAQHCPWAPYNCPGYTTIIHYYVDLLEPAWWGSDFAQSRAFASAFYLRCNGPVQISGGCGNVDTSADGQAATYAFGTSMYLNSPCDTSNQSFAACGDIVTSAWARTYPPASAPAGRIIETRTQHHQEPCVTAGYPDCTVEFSNGNGYAKAGVSYRLIHSRPQTDYFVFRLNIDPVTGTSFDLEPAGQLRRSLGVAAVGNQRVWLGLLAARQYKLPVNITPYQTPENFTAWAGNVSLSVTGTGETELSVFNVDFIDSRFDANNDGRFNAHDIPGLESFLGTSGEDEIKRLDVTGDREVTAADIAIITALDSSSFASGYFGDRNGDGHVNCSDFATMSDFVYTLGDAGYKVRLDADLDGDNDSADYSFYLSHRPTADVDDGTATGTPDGGVTIDDLLYYQCVFQLGSLAADVDDGSSTGTKDGGVTIDDFLYYFELFEGGC